jgi:glycosyltransferase involved in cell wall biosynthesis
MAGTEPSNLSETASAAPSYEVPHLHLLSTVAPVDPVRGSDGANLDLNLDLDDGRPDAIKLSILMAAYNEERTILRAVRGVLRQSYPCEIELIVVDDGSTDQTPALLDDMDDQRLAVYRHDTNQGKGASLLTAISMATGTHAVPFDADLEYAPEDIGKLLRPVLAGRYDVVYGARLFGINTVYHSYRYAVGNRVLTLVANVLYNAYLSDMHTCLKLMPLETLRRMRLNERGFGLDTQVTALLLRGGVRPFEVPVSYYSRSHAQGKKINWRDAVKCLWILFKTRMLPNKLVRPAELAIGAARP